MNNEADLIPIDAEELTTFNAQVRRSYGGKFTIDGRSVPCFTPKQMRNLYPGKQYIRAAEYAPHTGGTQIGDMKVGRFQVPVSMIGANNRLLYREAGYLATEDPDTYIVLLKSALPVRIPLLALCLAMIVVGVLFVPSLLAAGAPATAAPVVEGSAPPLDLETGAVDWDGVRTGDTGGVRPGIAIPGYKSITIAANTTDVQVNFQNPKGNPCYFIISLTMADGTELYRSKLIEPGKGLYEIELTQKVEPGEHDAVVQYDTFALADQSPMNGAQVQIKLIAN